MTALSPDTLFERLADVNRPLILDVRIDADFDVFPNMIPGALRWTATDLPDDLSQPMVITCHKGLKLSQGLAAWVTARGGQAQYLQGGMVAWRSMAYPSVPHHPAPLLWVIAEDHPDTVATEWVLKRFLPTADLLRVPSSSVADVADRFAANAVSEVTDVIKALSIAQHPAGRFIEMLQTQSPHALDIRGVLSTLLTQPMADRLKVLDVFYTHARITGELS